VAAGSASNRAPTVGRHELPVRSPRRSRHARTCIDRAQTRSHSHPCFARLWTGLGGSHGHVDTARAELVEGLAGRVLEVGAGDGRSFAHYPAEVAEIVAVEPEPYLRRRALSAARSSPLNVTVIAGLAEHLPVADHSFDAVVVSLVLCSVTSQSAALAEIRRVLRPEGELRFLEHIAAPSGILNSTQRLLDGSHVWPTLGAGCHLSRDTLDSIWTAGFRIATVRSADMGTIGRVIPFVIGTAQPTDA
jgi:ubiquinone/menaquinone biosynthesis C-methylase UbiE